MTTYPINETVSITNLPAADVDESETRVFITSAQRDLLVSLLTAYVRSFNGRTGDVLSSVGDYNLDLVTDTATRLAFTPAERAKLANLSESPVVSVNGRDGDVVLDKNDVGLPNVLNALQLIASFSYVPKASPTAGDKLLILDQADGQPKQIDWAQIAGAVSSVFGRLGDVTAQPGDYTCDQVTETAIRTFFTPTERTKLSSIEANAQVNTVLSVHGRVGTVTAQTGDYTAAHITDAGGKVLMLDAERAKLAGIQAGAQVNPTNLDGVPDSATRLALTVAERAKLATINLPYIVVNTSRDLATTDINHILHCGVGVTLTVTQAVLDAMSTHLDVVGIYAPGSTVAVAPGTGITIRRVNDTSPKTVAQFGYAAITKVNTSVATLSGGLVA